MIIELTEITKSSFMKLDQLILFENILTDKAYGTLSDGIHKYKFGWQSKGIRPNITLLRNFIYSIGIDLNFTILNFEKNEIILNLSLDYFFCETKIYNNFLYIATELEVIKVEITHFKIVKTYPLPDLFVSIKHINNDIIVHCMGDFEIFIV